MAWTYSDWRSQSTDSAKLARLALHIEEVSNKQGGKLGVSGGGMSIQFDSNYLATLNAEYVKLDSTVRRFASGGPVSLANLNGRPK